LIASEIGIRGRLSVDNVHELLAEGNEIGSHGLTHRSLAELGPSQLRSEVERSRQILTDFDVRSFAYPYGHYDEKIATEVARYYDSARAYSRVPVPNVAEQVDKYALQAFSIEGRFESRIDPRMPDFIMRREGIMESKDWYILILHGRASARIPTRPRDLTIEQMRGYMNYLRATLKSNRVQFLRNLEAFCEHLAQEKITVTTVSDGVARLSP